MHLAMGCDGMSTKQLDRLGMVTYLPICSSLPGSNQAREDFEYSRITVLVSLSNRYCANFTMMSVSELLFDGASTPKGHQHLDAVGKKSLHVGILRLYPGGPSL